jgi:hypothetical protein
VKVSLFSQFFLTETRLFPIFANIVANQSAVLWILRHSPLPKQNAGDRSHKLTALVFSVGARTKGDQCSSYGKCLGLASAKLKRAAEWLSSLKLAPRGGRTHEATDSNILHFNHLQHASRSRFTVSF